MEDSVHDTPDLSAGAEGPKPGAVLRDAREHYAMSVADAARLLRLSPRQVEAIEADEYHRLPGGPFVRGFVRNYARLLQIDPEPLLEVLNGYAPVTERAQLAPESKEIPFPTAQKKSWSRVVALSVLLLLALGLLAYEGFLQYLPQQVKMLAPSPAPVPVPRPAPPPAAAPPSEPVLSVQPVPIPSPAPVMEVVPPPAASAPEAASPPPAPAGASQARGRIRLEFAGDAWVEVRDGAGKMIYSQLSQGGATKSVEGTPPLSLVVGNAPVVRVFYNGAPVALEPHSRAGVARVTLK